MTRAVTFMIVGAIGFAVQAATLTVLTRTLDLPTAFATALAVEAAILVNFFWHERWTWRDRPAAARGERLWQFHAANGVTSIAGNVAITTLLAAIGWPLLAANAVAVATLGTVNYLLADRWVFAARTTLAGLLVLTACAGSAAAAGPGVETLSAWQQHVAVTESQLSRHYDDAPLPEPVGRTIGVPDGSIHEWRGSVRLAHTTVERVVNALTVPGTPPPQSDVVESRVLAKDGLKLRVYLKLVRKAIVTVTYDTEHDVEFSRPAHGFATSRSVATRVTEADGGDRGFLWKLNSYWRYRQVGDDVQVDVLSLSLSRDVPLLLKPIAGPIVGRIARESMVRTLEAMQQVR